ncbi:DNA-processing protein DprA [Desertibaculum subflavum]|uniref:DNA-processing protein DprA n=1 Tax=Desertibaculum subflavum TaxID=2268458 RepID=UPI000E6639F1
MHGISRRPLSDAERLDWLRLIRTENVGPVTFRQLLRRFGTAARAIGALPDLARRGGLGRSIAIPPRAEAERELAATAAAGARLIALAEPDYPPALAALDDSPPLLVTRGDAALFARRMVGMVGARNASAAGIRIARDLAGALGNAGIVVVSGLARGIDAAAHQGALATGTVAVVAGGVDVVFPPEHEALQAQIAEIGAVVGEMPIGTRPLARHFPRRNRLISGLSLGVVVVEAALKSGSLITARFALDQGREVMAVPGSPLDPRARGSNDLIRQGATLVEGIDDVLQALGPAQSMLAAEAVPFGSPVTDEAPADADLARLRATITERLSPTPVEVDELIRQSGGTPGEVLMVLLELELAGRLQRYPGGRVAIS